MRRGKYGNKKTVIDGKTFASKREAGRYALLAALQQCDRISNLRTQVRYPLLVNGVKVCAYVADFVYHENGREIIEDSKGFRTREYILKKKLMKACLGIDIKEV